MTASYSILVNSTDHFEDCWQPFFTLFSAYWPHCGQPIYLNTEVKDYSSPNISITCTRNESDLQGRRLTWSECLSLALDKIQTEIILYIQDDYFLEAPVDVDILDQLAQIMQTNGLSHIGLTPRASQLCTQPTIHPLLREISQKARYRISLQAGLWNKKRLQYYLRQHENAWQFEIFGTRRAHHIKDTFYAIDYTAFDPLPRIIPYIQDTGVIKGRWNPTVPALFHAHGIDIDYETRGFYTPPHRLAKKISTLKKLASQPYNVILSLRR